MNADAGFRLPCDSFRSFAAFEAFVAAKRQLLDLRYAYETARAAEVAGPLLLAPGSCGLCLRATRFTTEMPERRDGQLAEPNWREQMVCGCPHRLNNRFRGLLHFLVSEIVPPPWTRLLLLGAAYPIESYLQRRVATVSVRARSGRLLRAPRFEPQSYHLILSCEHFHVEPALDDVLAGLRDALMPGGRLVFTTPFDTAAQVSRPPRNGNPGVLGWDILTRLAQAGFAGAAAHLFWSEELGYLGPFNLIFSASA